MTSIFARPPRTRQILANVVAAFDEARVASPAELVNAISAIQARGAGTSGPIAALGGSILIVAPLTIPLALVPIIIPEECPGLTIRALSRFPITAETPGAPCLFDVRAEFVTLKDLFIYGTAAGYFTRFCQTGTTFTGGRSANNLRLLHNDVFVDEVFADLSAGKCDDARLEGNFQIEANPAHAAGIVVDSSRVAVIGNTIEDGGGDSITVAANADHCRIENNDTQGGDITSAASAGNNVIMGNVLHGGVINRNLSDRDRDSGGQSLNL